MVFNLAEQKRIVGRQKLSNNRDLNVLTLNSPKHIEIEPYNQA